MKKVLLPVLALCLCLTACAQAAGPSEPLVEGVTPSDDSFALDPQPGSSEVTTVNTLTGKAARVSDSSLLVACDNGDLVLLPSADLPPEVTAGCTVEIQYDGTKLETWPLQLSNVAGVDFTAEGDDLVGLYLKVIDELWTTDAGLNPAEGTLVFDLDALTNLTAGEKQAILYETWQKYGLEGRFGTFDSLVADGVIDPEKPDFPDGMFIGFSDFKSSGDAFSFSAQKWRSALGADFFGDCLAEKGPGGWTYNVGSRAAA